MGEIELRFALAAYGMTTKFVRRNAVQRSTGPASQDNRSVRHAGVLRDLKFPQMLKIYHSTAFGRNQNTTDIWPQRCTRGAKKPNMNFPGLNSAHLASFRGKLAFQALMQTCHV
jgi:hypothetical protein